MGDEVNVKARPLTLLRKASQDIATLDIS
jgi:hypothetical protein